MHDNRNFAIFAAPNSKNMKYTEMHRRFVKAGWKFDHAEGSHYFYIRNGVMSEPIPYHGAHEIPNGLAKKLMKKYGI